MAALMRLVARGRPAAQMRAAVPLLRHASDFRRSRGEAPASVDDILEEMNHSTAPPAPAWLGTSERVVRLARPRAEAELQQLLAELRWHEDPAKVLGKENRLEVYLARLVATSVWRNRSMPTETKRKLIKGVVDNLQELIAVREGKVPHPEEQLAAMAAKSRPAKVVAPPPVAAAPAADKKKKKKK